ncbi:MAG: RHS repeat-associated core domain-containing protein, partial [Acidobacteriaceae bacterium]
MTWAYDGWGDRSSQRISEGSLEWPQDAYSFSANNQIEQDSYDAAGNETYDGFHTYAYDDEGRIAAVDGGGTAQYVYDADGLRVHKTGGEGPEDFVYDLGGRAVATYSSTNGGWVRGEIYAGAMHVGTYGNSTTYFSSTDWQGTERVRSDVNGNSVESCSDLAFGDDQNCTGSDPSPLHLTGKMRDTETGLDYFGARYYASNAGRWMLPDWSAVPEPVPYADLSNPQTLNLYTYVGNNPINGIDADGHSSDGNNGQPCGWYGTTGSAPGSVVTPAQVPCSAPDNGPY